MAPSMLYPMPSAEPIAPWLARSVTDYFAAIVWEPLPPPLPIVAHPEAAPLTLKMSVVEYFANFPWGGSVAADASADASLVELSALADGLDFDDLNLADLDVASLDGAIADAANADAAAEQVSFEELFAASFDAGGEPESGAPGGDPATPAGPSLSDFSDFF